MILRACLGYRGNPCSRAGPVLLWGGVRERCGHSGCEDVSIRGWGLFRKTSRTSKAYTHVHVLQ